MVRSVYSGSICFLVSRTWKRDLVSVPVLAVPFNNPISWAQVIPPPAAPVTNRCTTCSHSPSDPNIELEKNSDAYAESLTYQSNVIA